MKKVRGAMAVLVWSAAGVLAQAAPASPDAAKPTDYAACRHDKDGKMGCCKKDEDGKMVGGKDGCKKGQCDRAKKEAGKKS